MISSYPPSEVWEGVHLSAWEEAGNPSEAEASSPAPEQVSEGQDGTSDGAEVVGRQVQAGNEPGTT